MTPQRESELVAVTMTTAEAHVLAIALYEYGLCRENGQDQSNLYQRLMRASGDRRTHPAQRAADE